MKNYNEFLVAMKLILDFLKLWDKHNRKSEDIHTPKRSKKK